ncbi:MAG: DUF4468 domain-containing protein [Rikenellaceae bacterium]|nr:DUF4468 domain-containing protein [Rikenellaceae bacterium]
MKKLLLLAVFAFTATISASAQVVTAQEVEAVFEQNYGGIPKNGKGWMALADTIYQKYPLDFNGQISTTTIIDVPGKTKDELYILANSWFIASFNSGKAVIQLNDKEAGVIIGKGYLEGVGHRDGFSKSVNISEYIIARIDIKDEKVRLITTIQEYEMSQSTGIGLALMGAGVRHQGTFSIIPSQAYPFDAKTHKAYNREAAIGYAAGIVWGQIIKQKLQDALWVGITGDDSEDW